MVFRELREMRLEFREEMRLMYEEMKGFSQRLDKVEARLATLGV
jgi:hypothetical protein